MSSRRKVGYNWKARQRRSYADGDNGDTVPEVEGLLKTDSYYVDGGGHGTVSDSNAFILPSKRKKSDVSHVESAPKRKKLSSKQKKRLQRILEAKEKKVQVMF